MFIWSVSIKKWPNGTGHGPTGPVFEKLGLTVEILLENDIDERRKRKAYQADIVYGALTEFGFDHLRDELKTSDGERINPDRHVILLEDAYTTLLYQGRTPLIMASRDFTNQAYFTPLKPIAEQLVKHQENDRLEIKRDGPYFSIDSNEQVHITEKGWAHLSPEVQKEHEPVINALIRAFVLFNKGREYIIDESKVVVRDIHTGVLYPGREFADGLHQAIEAKEGLEISGEQVERAKITIQDFLKLYEKRAGLTEPAAQETMDTYEDFDLEVVRIRTV